MRDWTKGRVQSQSANALLDSVYMKMRQIPFLGYAKGDVGSCEVPVLGSCFACGARECAYNATGRVIGSSQSFGSLVAAVRVHTTSRLVWMLFSIVSWSIRRKIKRGKEKVARSSQSSVGFRFIPVQVAAGVGIVGAEASELLKVMLSDDLSAAAIRCELVLVGAFVILVVAAASELLNSVLLAALSAAALFFTVTTVGAFVIWVGAAASELLNAGMCTALSAAALFTEITLVVAFVICSSV